MTLRAQRLVAAVFVVMLATPPLLLALGVRPGAFENRELTPAPDLAWASLVDEDDYAQLGRYLTDRFPFRDDAVRLEADLRSLTGGAGTADDRPRGADGWLYHHQTLLAACNRDMTPADFFAEGDPAAASLAEAGIPFVFVVAPDKAGIHPEHLPLDGLAGRLGLAGREEPACGRRFRTELTAGMADRPWLTHLAPHLAEAAAQGIEVFSPLDTHWTDLGGLIAAEAIVESFEPGLWDDAAVVVFEPRSAQGDLTVLAGEPARQVVPSAAVIRPGVTTENHDEGSIHSGDDRLIRRSTSTGPRLIEGTTVMVADSFGRRTIRHLEPYFEELVVVGRGWLDEHPAWTATADTPDRIVVEQVQRNIAWGRLRHFDALEEWAGAALGRS